MENTPDTTDTTPDTAAEAERPDVFATYCPEDNKLRLYCGRVGRLEFLALRSEGWTTLHKQREAGGGDFAAVWTPTRRDTALRFCDVILDEDMGPAERAADRAERFAGYREKRVDDATGHADRYDAGPAAHGYQSEKRAERAASRHDKIAGRAVDAWDKAEYWQRRTAGVIAHALHVSAPHVRMGRIKELEAEIRKCEKSREDYDTTRARWVAIQAMPDGDEKTSRALYLAGAGGYIHDYLHPRPEEVTNAHVREKGSSLWSLLNLERDGYGKPITAAEACALWLDRHPEQGEEGSWLTHYRNRLAYENAMIEAQGGRLGSGEIEIGGTIAATSCRARLRVLRSGGLVIAKINKSPASGRVVSVGVIVPKVSEYTYQVANVPGTSFALFQIDVERMDPEAYQPPTDESRAKLAEFEAAKKAAAKARKDTATPCPIINPTDEDAERLQALWNVKNRAEFFRVNGDYESTRKTWAESAPKVEHITQAVYSENSRGTYAKAETRQIYALGVIHEGSQETGAVFLLRHGPALFQIRTASGRLGRRVLVLSDKPKKPLPAAVWEAFADAPKAEDVRRTLPEVFKIIATLSHYGAGQLDEAQLDTLHRAAACGFVNIGRFVNRPQWTDAGMAEWRKVEAEAKVETQEALALT
jgi:hypothetical protein